MIDLVNRYVSKVEGKMPFESLLFFTYHIWLFVMILTAIIIIGTGIHLGLDIYLVFITLGLSLLYFVPIASIVQNIVYSRKDAKKILCCFPLLIVGIFHTLTAFALQIRIAMYEGHPDLFIYILLLPIQRLVGFVADPLLEGIFNMDFPYNMLIPIVFYVVIFPTSLLIYLLPSINYNKGQITKEMKLIPLLSIISVLLPVTIQALRMAFGLIDDIMLQFFWTETLMNIGKILFLLNPMIGILYVKHYNKTKTSKYQ